MDPIKKATYLGLGALSLTKERAEEIIDDLIKRGEMSGNNRAAMVDRLLKAVTDLGLPTRKEYETIVSKLDAIEKAIATLKREKGRNKG